MSRPFSASTVTTSLFSSSSAAPSAAIEIEMAALLGMGALVALAAMAAVPPFALAANYNVGGPGGSWDLSTDFTGWVSGKKFHVGDTLTFQHAATQHNVLEVSRAAYAACATGNPISTDAGGKTVVKLTAAGKRYFICGIAGHCSAGMKVEIDVLAASPAASSPSPSPAPPSSSPQRSSLAAAPSSASRRSPTDATSPAGSSDALPASKPTTKAVASGGAPAKAVAGFGSGLLMLVVLVLSI